MEERELLVDLGHLLNEREVLHLAFKLYGTIDG